MAGLVKLLTGNTAGNRTNPNRAAGLGASAHLRDRFFAPFEEHFNRFFDEFFGTQCRPSQVGFPRVDVYEQENAFVVEFAMAGVDPAFIKVEIQDHPTENVSFGVEYGKYLTVSGKMAAAYEHRKDAQYHIKELTRKHFSRSMLLPNYVEGDPVATFESGMLTLKFPTTKRQEAKPVTRTIPIKAIEHETDGQK